MGQRIKSKVLKAGKPVQGKDIKQALGFEDADIGRKNYRPKEAPGAIEVEEIGNGSFSKAVEYTTIEVESSKGKRYRIVVPQSYAEGIPRKWKWDIQKYQVAELIAHGVPISQIPRHPEITLKSRMTIYAWLQHPEFKEHVDGLTLETGWANKRERIAGLNRLTDMLFSKLANEIDGVKLTDKSIGAIISGLQQASKLISQEKEEFVEESKVTQETHLSGSITTIEAKLDDFMASKTDDERRALEEEFDKIGNSIIEGITGAKETAPSVPANDTSDDDE